MFDSKLDHKLSLAAAVLGFLTVAGCSNQPATVASSQSAQAANQATSSAAASAATVSPASPADDPARAATASPASPAADSTHATQPLHLVTLPKGTEITATVRQTLATDKNHWGDSFSARLARSVKVDGKTVLPRGTAITGRIYEVKTHELKVVLSSVVVDGIYCDLITNSRRPSDKEPKPSNRKQKKNNSTLSARTRLTFKLSKPATVPVKA